MEDEILCQVPGFTITRSHKATTLFPYSRSVIARGDGTVNYGWIDLRDHPERVTEIPEANRSPGLSKLLQVIADPVSGVMSSACECWAFEPGRTDDAHWSVGGFVEVMFKDVERNANAQNLVDLAYYIAAGIAGSSHHQTKFELVIEPLKLFFERTDCYALMLKVLGYGSDEAAAWAAFDYAASAAAEAIQRDRSTP